jgi:hypothetical protein
MASGCCQSARVRDFAFSDRSNLGRLHCHHGCRLSIQRGEFGFVRQAVSINMHHRADVTGFQGFGRDSRGQYYSFMFHYHTLSAPGNFMYWPLWTFRVAAGIMQEANAGTMLNLGNYIHYYPQFD